MNEEKNILPLRKDLVEREHRLASLNYLVNKLAHDFNNALAPFTGWFSLIKEECEPDSTTFLYAKKGEDVATKVKNMLEDVMNSVKPERRFTPVEFDLSQILEEELTSWKRKIPESVNLEVYDEIHECIIVSDPDHWRKAISNLLDNARYGLALGGKLEVSLKRDFLTEERRKEFGIVTNEPWLLMVKDNGFGIPPEIIDKIFDPFFSTRSKSDSLGLGLTHLYGLIRLHGGQVIIESETDKGTTVYAWFNNEPVKKDFAKIETKEQKSAKKSNNLLEKKVLLVDDDPLVLEVLKSFLHKRCFNVIAMNSGKAALEFFKKRPDDFGLVISDIRMQGMNGVELVESIIKIKEDIPVLFISGEKDEILQNLLSRFDRKIKLIKKPCTFTEFFNTIEEVLGK